MGCGLGTDVRPGADPGQQVRAPKQRVDMTRAQAQPVLLRRDQQVFHGMGQPDPCIQVEDTRGALQRMRRAHAGIQRGAVGRIALQFQQPGIQHRGLRLGLLPEQLQHRCVAQAVAHARLPTSACSRAVSSSTVTARPRQCRIERAKRATG